LAPRSEIGGVRGPADIDRGNVPVDGVYNSSEVAFFPLAPGFAGVFRDERSATHVERKDRSILAQTPAEPGANGKRQLPPLNDIVCSRLD
jgi:hypothetical protein